jgi:hypothetical protein
MLEYFLNFRAVGLDAAMADRALLCARYEHVRRLAIAIFMTEGALNLPLSGVDAVAVSDWLYWRPRRAEGIPIDHGSNDYEHNAQGNEESASSH